MWTGRVALGLGRLGLRLLPTKLLRDLDDRFFGAVFQVTRVTNDAYGWRPEPAAPPIPSEGMPAAGKAPTRSEP